MGLLIVIYSACISLYLVAGFYHFEDLSLHCCISLPPILLLFIGEDVALVVPQTSVRS